MNVVVTLEATSCCVCGVEFAMPDVLLRKRLANKGSFWCPNGHSLAFTESSVQRLQRQLNAAQDATARAEARARDAENRRRAAVGQTTKLRNRISDGVCPCCHRTFVNVQRHMATKHPDFAGEEPT